MRLNAFLAQAGVASRRGADELIKAGRVKVNGQVGQLNDQISQNDSVELDGKEVLLRQFRYILLNKPAGYITTMNDPQGRPKVIDLINAAERVVPVGRLDADTTGVLLLTNDGALAHRLMHPSGEVGKVYEAEVKGTITADALSKLEKGVELDDGPSAPATARKLADNKVELIIHEGRKHQVKRMLAAVGLSVVKLHRPTYAGLGLEGLAPGEWRDLSAEEVSKLKMLQ